MRLTGLVLALGAVLLAATSCASAPSDSGSAERVRSPDRDRDMRPRNTVPSSTP